MAFGKKPKVLRTEAGASPASAASDEAPKKTGGIKRRSEVPVVAIPAEDIPSFPGEFGAAIAAIAKKGDFGQPFIKASSRRLDLGRQPTGILALDLALGGGFARSRIHMLYGEKSSGKSTTALQSIAALHRVNPDGLGVWIDVEGTFDRAWAQKLGCDLERLLIVQPETGEHAVDLADTFIRVRETEMVVLDSIAMLVPMREIDESVEKDTMALQARLSGKYLRKATNGLIKERARNHTPIVININQWRMKVGLVFGDPRTLPGGKILEFSTTQQVETKNVEHKSKDEDGNDIIDYNEHNFKVTKNKAGGPMKEATFKLIRLDGLDGMPEGWVDQAKTVHRFGSQMGLITGPMQSFNIEGVGNFRGSEALTKWALQNKDAYYRIQTKIIEGFRKRWALDA
jgi:recombination protein RecA